MTRSVFLLLTLLRLGPALCEDASAPPRDVRIYPKGKPAVSAVDLDFTDGRINAKSPVDDQVIRLDRHQVERLKFPVSGEKLLAYRKTIKLQVREPVLIPHTTLPDALQIQFTVPMETGLYFTPLVDKDQVALRNTMRFWIGSKTVTAQSRGIGRNELNAMEEWTKAIPNPAGKKVVFELLLDRKNETCSLHVNHTYMHSWKIPTSYNVEVDGITGSLFRSGIDPQVVREFSVYTWTPSPEGSPEPDADHSRDRLYLQNGDLLKGTVVSIRDQTIWIQLESPTPIPVPFPRIRELVFSTP